MKTNQLIASECLHTPIGCLHVQADDKGLQSVLFIDSPTQNKPNRITSQACQQLDEYFAGRRQAFDLPLNAQGTDFQKQVWQALCNVAYGESCSYQHIGLAINNPKAVRAIGAANGRNPISIIVPCHRVIGANGNLTGYAGGLERKAWLLDWEAKHR